MKATGKFAYKPSLMIAGVEGGCTITRTELDIFDPWPQRVKSSSFDMATTDIIFLRDEIICGCFLKVFTPRRPSKIPAPAVTFVTCCTTCKYTVLSLVAVTPNDDSFPGILVSSRKKGKDFVPPYQDPHLKLGGLLALNLHEFSSDVEEIADQVQYNLVATTERKRRLALFGGGHIM